MTARNLTEDERWKIAGRLDKIPTACWADLAGWAMKGYIVVEDEFGELEQDHTLPVSGGANCAMEAAVHKHGCCWCGKFRTGLELAETVELPVHELALAAEPSRWLDAIEPASLLDTVAEATDLEGDDCG